MSRSSRTLLVFAALVLPALSARAHKPLQTNLYLDIELTETALQYELWIGSFLFPPLDDIEFADKENRPTLEERGEAIAAHIDQHCPVKIDGLHVKPVMDSLVHKDMEQAFHLGELTDFVMARMKWHYPVKAKPEQISMTWGVWLQEPDYGFEGLVDPDQDPKELDLIITVYGKQEYARFAPSEPEFVWHAKVDVDDLFVADVNPIPDPVFPLPVGSILIGAAGVGILLVSKIPKMGRLGIVAVAAVAAFLTTNVMSVDVPKFWAPKAPTLQPQAAAETFVKLQQNVYRAFDYENEEDIYDALAQSVDGVLLDKIYTEIYQSLILRDEGGAVSKVQKVHVLDGNAEAIDENDPDAGYSIDCRWRVHGFVKHYEHVHTRVNEYEARYTMAPRGDRWKITNVTVNEQTRLDPKTLKPVNDVIDPESEGAADASVDQRG